MGGFFTALSVGFVPWAVFLTGGLIAAAVSCWMRWRRGKDAGRDARLVDEAVRVVDEVAQARSARFARQNPPSARTDSTPAQRLAGTRILAVDDDDDWRELLTKILAGAGADARVVPSVADALHVVAAWRPDVVLTDLQMPGTDGYALAAAIAARRDRTRPIPTVAMSAHGSAQERIRTARAGFVAHLTKPVLADELITTLARAADPAPRARAERRVV